jgi:uncharacterized protein YdaU (DUF1376 family)
VIFYRRFTGDYARDTPHLNFEQHGAYNLCLDLSYTTEKPLPLDREKICRMTRANSPSEKDAIDVVLEEFYKKTRSGYVHKRVTEEIKHASSRAKAARQNGKFGGRPRKKGNPPGSVRKPNDNPVGFSGKPTGNPAGYPAEDQTITREEAISDSRFQSTEVADPCAENRARKRATRPLAGRHDPLFKKFCEDYPRKIRLKETGTVWRTLSEADRIQAVEALTAFTTCEDWREQNGKFIPSPHRFLSERRWEHIPVGEKGTNTNGSSRKTNSVNSHRGTDFSAEKTVLPEL